MSLEIGEAGAGGTAGAAAASGMAAVAAQNGGAAAGLTDRERRKQKRIAKRERRLPAKLEVCADAGRWHEHGLPTMMSAYAVCQTCDVFETYDVLVS